MSPANPLPPPQSVSLYPTNVYFIGCFSTKQCVIRCGIRVRGLSCSSKTTVGGGEILPNALQRSYPSWRGGGFSLGVDLGASHTGLALGKGFFPRPLTVLDLRGKKLEMRLLKIADMEEVDEFIIGLPKSHDGKETPQSNKVRSIAGRIAVQAAERGWRVYLQDEHGTTLEALDLMIERRLKRSVRQRQIDAFSALGFYLFKIMAARVRGTEFWHRDFYEMEIPNNTLAISGRTGVKTRIQMDPKLEQYATGEIFLNIR